jgi:hypothetical protein
MDKEYFEGVGNRHEYLFGSFDEKRGSFSGSQRWLVYGGNFASRELGTRINFQSILQQELIRLGLVDFKIKIYKSFKITLRV